MTFEIITSRDFWKRVRWISYVTVPFALLGLLNAYHAFTGNSNDAMTMGLAMLAIGVFIGSAPLFLLIARRFWVQRFDEQGVVLRNGRRFLWKDFQKIEPRMNYRLKIVNNYDLYFTTGKAGVYHLMAENYGELMAIVNELEAGKNRFYLR